MAVLLALDLLVASVRASLLNIRLPYLLSLREQREAAVDRTVAIINRPRLRTSLRLSITLLHMLLAVMAVLLYSSYAPLSLWLAVGGILLASALLLLVEFIIEGYILRHPEEMAVRLASVGKAIDFLLTPLSLPLLSLWGNPWQKVPNPVTEEDLKNWVMEGPDEGGLEKGERQMIYSIFHFGDTLAREVMVPRIDVMALELGTLLEDAIDALTRSGHSRVPVYEDTIDNVVGLLYAKDLLKVRNANVTLGNLKQILRPAYFIPEAKKVDDLLAEMRSRGMHMAIAVDEYGGMAGIITLEDIVEEIIGEIRDEYDQSEELLYQEIAPGEFVFLGSIDLDDFNELMGTHLTKDAADTLAGYVYGQVGSVPVGGEKIEAEDVHLVVEQVSGHRIRKVRAWRSQDNPENTAEETNANR